VRSCYRSKWRLIRGEADLREGFVWFCPPSTPFYPGLHNLGSRDWTSDEREPQPPLGEYSGARQWYRGDPPTRRPVPILVGSRDCIENGDEPGLPVVPDKSAFCGEILPPACYAPEDSIEALTNPADCVFGKLSADILTAAYTDLPAAEALVTALLGPAAVVSSFSQPDAFTPAGVIAVVGDTAVLWLTGTTNHDQLAAQIFYAGFGPIDIGLYSTSGLYEAAALLIADQLNAAGAGAAARVVLVGHSFGGAVCMVLAAKMHLANPDRHVEILTLGAPKAGDDRLAELTRIFFQVHYATARDPIPFMPPRGVNFAALIPFIGPVLALFWPEFERTNVVKMITQDGLFIDERTDTLPDDLISVATLAIAANVDVPAFRDHQVDWYAYWLCKACPCVPRPCVAPAEPVLGFRIELDMLFFDQGAGPESLSIADNIMTATAFFPGGKPSTWQVTIPFIAHAVIEATIDGGDNYTSFRVFVEPVPVSPLWLCFWDFSAAEVMAGITTSDPPDTFNDTFIFLSSLIVLPNLV